VVTEYLTETGLLPYLEKLGFALAATAAPPASATRAT
jgi:aconitase A